MLNFVSGLSSQFGAFENGVHEFEADDIHGHLSIPLGESYEEIQTMLRNRIIFFIFLPFLFLYSALLWLSIDWIGLGRRIIYREHHEHENSAVPIRM